VPGCFCCMPLLQMIWWTRALRKQKYITSRQRGVHLHPPYPPWIRHCVHTHTKNGYTWFGDGLLVRTNDEHVTVVLYKAYYVLLSVCLVVLHGCQCASAHLLKCIWCTPIEKHLPTPLLANRNYNVACTSVTSLKLHDVTVALLKYGRYMNKLELSV